MTQTAAFRPDPISQRDGSPLASSNCRPSSIATGIAYESATSSQPKGSKRSTGATMRSYMSDQSGGTSSADAVEAWSDGYGETLSVRDGSTFDDALEDLRAGRLVHLDVWHASCGSAPGICRSGSGAYGHTMAVLPDLDASGWLVADPWCSPPKWGRVPESQLRAGAEEWGRRVYGTAVYEADYPTGGTRAIGDPRAVLALVVVRRIVKVLMDLAYPGADWTGDEVPTPADWPETGGARPILYTRTTAHAPGGADEMISTRGLTLTSSHGVTLPAGTTVRETPDSGGKVVGTFGGPVDYFGAVGDWRAVRVNGPDGSVIAYSSTGATPYAKTDTPDEPDDGETPEEAYERGRADEWDTWAGSMGIPERP